jgi:hypothetical protein
MFREHVTLIEEAVLEGSKRGVDFFLETLNQDMQVEEIIEESGGIDEAMKQLYTENGYEITELEEESEVLNEESNEELTKDEEMIDKKLDGILENLKEEGLVD